MGVPMATNLDFIETIFSAMLEAGFVSSKAEFSTEYLDKGASYLTSMSARARRVPNETIGQLALNLEVQRDAAAAEVAKIVERHAALHTRHAVLAGLLSETHGQRIENLGRNPAPIFNDSDFDDDLLGRYMASLGLERIG
jgi:hypothetical protein